MQRKLLYLINPVSGTKNKKFLRQNIVKQTERAEFDFDIIYTRADGNYSELRALIIQNHFTDVVICGGDGTVSTVTSFLLNLDISIGIIPTGSGNGLALTARIPYSTKNALKVIFAGNASTIDGYTINGKFSCMMCGIGNDAQIAHDFALTKVRGLKTYLKLSAKKYFSLKPFSFIICTEYAETRIDAFFITISNSNQFGNYVTIAPRASLNDGLLDVVVVKKMNRLYLPFALLRQISGNNAFSELHNKEKKKSIVYFQTKALQIKNLDCAPMHIDGEPAPPSEEINIKILPNAFRLLHPYRRQVAVNG